VSWQNILKVFQNEVPWECIISVKTVLGEEAFTGGHKVFVSPTKKVKVEDLKVGDFIVSVQEHSIFFVPVLGIKELPPRKYMYDLSVDVWANYKCAGLLVKNCPDRNYHFRPPEYEGDIGQYNRIFGQIWEDEELLEYLLRSLDWFNMFPPLTQKITNLTLLIQSMPSWRTAILWGAITHACFALSANWIADEFSVRGDQEVTVVTKSGKEITLPIKELYEICKD